MVYLRVPHILLLLIANCFILCALAELHPVHPNLKLSDGARKSHRQHHHLFIPREEAGFSVTSSPQITTQGGDVQGYTYEQNDYFLGLPFAAPPLNDNRFRPPQSPSSWTGVLNATEYGAICLQAKPYYPVNMSEDCLYLNVIRPSNATATSNLSVMVWIYGGSFTSGGSNFYDPTALVNAADGGVIGVTLNYRLGVFGELTLNELAAENSSDPTTGFYGIQDQRMAMQWVKENIAAFGGNPEDVTIFGESAGAISVCTHVAASKSAGLFNRAIMESGFCSMLDFDAALTMAANLTNDPNVGCQNETGANLVSCLRAIPADALYEYSSHTDWWPALDPTEFPSNLQPLTVIQNGDYNAVSSLLLGTNENEEGLFLCPSLANITELDYLLLVKHDFNILTTAWILALYPPQERSVLSLIDLSSDYTFKCQTKYMAAAVSSSSPSSSSSSSSISLPTSPDRPPPTSSFDASLASFRCNSAVASALLVS
eukprot:TRINITY_DN232_c0_g1_i1.p1 TRINITY_DN232_c0_g1~~TRINITY_DN232_c0_g1_i1.p1  ORF type:complete len:486 (-),score=102.69 TRINITY_DN232_c0_g1_i1:1010-2467(-)